MKRLYSSLLIILLLATSIPSILTHKVAQASTIKLNQTNLCLGKLSENGYRGYRLRVLNTKSKVTWKSSNSKVATVNSKGWVDPKSEGTTTITATIGKTKLNCKVYVEFLPKYMNESDITLFVGDQYPLHVGGGVIKSATWTTSNKSIATIKKESGRNDVAIVTAKKVGTSTIKVVVDNKLTFTCKVTVKKKEKIKIKQEYVQSGQNILVKTTNLSPVSAYVSVRNSFYLTEEDYNNKKVALNQSESQVIQAGQTVVTKFTKPITLGYNNIEDVYYRYEVTYELYPLIDALYDLNQNPDGLKASDVKTKITETTKNEIEVAISSDAIDEVYLIMLAAVYYKDGKMIDIQEDLLLPVHPDYKTTTRIQTAQFGFYDRLEYDKVEVFVNKLRLAYK